MDSRTVTAMPRTRLQLGRRAVVLPALLLAVVAIGFTLVGVPMGLATLDQYGPTGPVFLVIFPAIVLSLTLVGGFVAVRVPANPVGWLLEISGALAAVGIFGGSYVNYGHAVGASLPLAVPIAWASSWTLVTTIGLLVVYVPLLFPTGRFLSPRWRTFGLVGIAGVGGSMVGAGLAPGPLSSTPWITNPLGISGATDLLALLTLLSNLASPVFFGGAVVSVFARYRRAGVVERQQLKWFGLVAGATVVTFAVSIPNNGPVSDAAWEVGLALLPLLPVAIGLAILRYRLWDIDRIVSRTLGWAIITGILVGLFAAAIVAMDAVLSGVTQGQTLAVAVSTLVAASLFQPLRGRVQRGVDRRFDRARYDGQRLVDEFSASLRDEVDLAAIGARMLATTTAAVRPQHGAVWLRGGTR